MGTSVSGNHYGSNYGIYRYKSNYFAYRTEKGKLYVPATAIKGTIINAGAWKKDKKIALRPLLAGGIRVTPSEIVLNNQKYEIDVRTVVIQRQRVLKWRPMINPWKLNFTITSNSDLLPDPMVIKTCLEEAGQRIGILDFRPTVHIRQCASIWGFMAH